MAVSILVSSDSVTLALRSSPRLRPTGAERADIRSAVGSNALPEMVPRLTMGSKPSKGYRGLSSSVLCAPTFAVMIANSLS